MHDIDKEKIDILNGTIQYNYDKKIPSAVAIHWREQVIALFKSLSSGSKVVDNHWRFCDEKIIKRFKEEAVSICTFLDFNSIYSNVEMFSGNQSYDAIVYSENDCYYIEVTCSKDGHLENKEMQHLAKHGRAPLTHGNKQLFKSEKIFETEYMAEVVLVEDQIESDLNHFKECYLKKCKKNYANDYILLINTSISTSEENIDRLLKKIFEFMKTQKPPFKEVWAVFPWINRVFKLS